MDRDDADADAATAPLGTVATAAAAAAVVVGGAATEVPLLLSPPLGVANGGSGTGWKPVSATAAAAATAAAFAAIAAFAASDGVAWRSRPGDADDSACDTAST